MNRIEELIDNWVKEYTVPFNTCPDRHRIACYTSDSFGKQRNNDPNKIEKAFNDLMQCIFIVYKGDRRIILSDPKHRFDFCFLDHWYYYNFDKLIDDLLKTEYKCQKAEHYYEENRNYISISISATQEVLNYFNIDYVFESEAKEWDFKLEDNDPNSDRFCYEDDGWDYNAEHYYHESEVFEKITEALKLYFQYERAPYKKYNPDFDQYKEANHIENFEEMIDALTFDQIIEILTGDYWGHGVKCMVDELGINPNKLETMRALDRQTLKNMLGIIIGESHIGPFIYGASVLYNI